MGLRSAEKNMTGEKHTSVINLAAGYAIAWGLFIANPWIDNFSRNPKLYEPMLQIAPFESIWGMIFGFAGAVAMFLRYTGKRRSAAFTMGVVFTAFAALFLIGDVSSPGWVLFGLIAVFNFIHWRALGWKSAKASNG